MTEPGKVWVGDISYISTDEGWLFLAVVIDLFSRQVVGWLREDMTLMGYGIQGQGHWRAAG